MAHNEYCLRPNETLKTGEWLRSTNGLFTAVMQGDSNFVIYRGDYLNTGYNTSMWSTVVNDCNWKSYAGPGSYNLHMQKDDGNLVIYRDGGGPVWAITTNHPISLKPGCWAILDDWGVFMVGPHGNEWDGRVFSTDVARDEIEYFKLNNLIYDLTQVKITPVGGPRHSESNIATNDTSVSQDATVTMTYTKSISKGWKTSTTLKIGTKTNFKAGVPSLAEGKVEVSAELSQTFEWNETTTDSNSVAVSLKVTVPPGKKIIGRCTWHDSTISAPFKVVGTGKFKKFDHELPITFEGVYEGAQTHDVETAWSEIKDDHPNLRFWRGAAGVAD